MEASNGAFVGGYDGHAFAIDVGSKSADFGVGSRDDVTVSGLKNGSLYTVIARNVDDSGNYYVVGDATVE